MHGRESNKSNALFYTCSLIDFIARKTSNHRSLVVSKLGDKGIQKIIDLADIYHCDNIEKVSDEFIKISGIQKGDFDNISSSRYSIPSHWDIGKVYKRLILGVSIEKNIDTIEAIKEVYTSFISKKIDDYNSSFYYEVPQNILVSYLNGSII